MSNFYGFLKKEGRKTFEESGFCNVDALIFCQLSYLNYDAAFAGTEDRSRQMPLIGITPFARSGILFNNIRLPEECKKLYFYFIQSPRYKDIKLSHYVNEVDYSNEKQFSAVVFNLPDKSVFVAFRGTDNTIVGWKEDFNMTFMTPVPAQADSVSYLNRIQKNCKGVIRVGGHSKGGNLAVFASAKCNNDIKSRITDIYNFDGPGFRKEFLSDNDYIEIRDKVKKFIPQSSIIGMLMYNQENHIVVQSGKKGFSQHDLFNWKIKDGDLLVCDEVKETSFVIDKTISEWLESLDDEKRRVFFDTLYDVVRQTKASTIAELNAEKRENAIKMLKALRGVDPQTRRFVLKAFTRLFAIAPRAIRQIRKSGHDVVSDKKGENSEKSRFL